MLLVNLNGTAVDDVGEEVQPPNEFMDPPSAARDGGETSCDVDKAEMS